jgi:arsenate reductase
MTKPAVLILCTHNAGGSQMAMGFFKHLAGEQASVCSGGSEPARAVNPAAIAAMAERGIDITTEQPKRWMPDMLESAEVLITMSCGGTCPILPGFACRQPRIVALLSRPHAGRLTPTGPHPFATNPPDVR